VRGDGVKKCWKEEVGRSKFVLSIWCSSVSLPSSIDVSLLSSLDIILYPLPLTSHPTLGVRLCLLLLTDSLASALDVTHSLPSALHVTHSLPSALDVTFYSCVRLCLLPLTDSLASALDVSLSALCP